MVTFATKLKASLYGLVAIAAALSAVLLVITVSPGRSPAQSAPTDIPVAGNSTANLVPPPRSIDELVQKSDIIVIGTVGRIVNEGAIGSYVEADNLRNDRATDPISSRIPIVDYEVEVEAVVLDDGILSSGHPLILRMSGRSTDPVIPGAEYPPSRVGDRGLFALTANPDGLTYGFHYGPWSRFDISGSVATFTDGRRTPVNFTDKVGTSQFIQALKDASAAKHTTGR